MFRRESGSVRTSFASIDSFCAADAVSTSGERSETVIVSSSCPTSIVKFCRTVWPASSSSASFVYVLKPCSSIRSV